MQCEPLVSDGWKLDAEDPLLDEDSAATVQKILLKFVDLVDLGTGSTSSSSAPQEGGENGVNKDDEPERPSTSSTMVSSDHGIGNNAATSSMRGRGGGTRAPTAGTTRAPTGGSSSKSPQPGTSARKDAKSQSPGGRSARPWQKRDKDEPTPRPGDDRLIGRAVFCRFLLSTRLVLDLDDWPDFPSRRYPKLLPKNYVPGNGDNSANYSRPPNGTSGSRAASPAAGGGNNGSTGGASPSGGGNKQGANGASRKGKEKKLTPLQQAMLDPAVQAALSTEAILPKDLKPCDKVFPKNDKIGQERFFD